MGEKAKNEQQDVVGSQECRADVSSVPAELANLIINSLPVGVVAFDSDLQIVCSNSCAGELVDIGRYVDRSLSKGTDAKLWGGWTGLLKSVLSKGKQAQFKAVRYGTVGRKHLLDLVCTPLLEGTTGKVWGGVLIIEDVTGQMDAQGQLAQVERLAAVGKVAGKVAHELNNPIDGILRYINLTLRSIEKEDIEKPKEYLQQCRTGLMRMVQIVSELLEFSRSTFSAFEYAGVDEIVEDAVRAMETKAADVEISIIKECPDSMVRIRSSNLYQVFCNLIKNAIDAMDGRGQLTVMIRCKDDMILVAFKDTGRGFAPESADVLFEPFYTTKGQGKGTGLGLAICKDIVEKYDGSITAENNAERGSTFTVKLPLTSENLVQGR